MKQGGLRLVDGLPDLPAVVIDMAGSRPRKLLGLPPQRLRVGDAAELMLFDWSNAGITIRYVF